MSLDANTISMIDVKNVLGETSDTLLGLSVSSLINKWSRWKPILYSGDIISDSILVANNFGLYVNSNTNYQTAAALEWGYTKPTSFARLGDFRNYEHEATTPISVPSTLQNLNLNKVTQTSYNMAYMFSAGGVTSIGLDELSAIQDKYIGIVIVDGSGNTYPITATETIANGGTTIPLDLTAAPFASVTSGTTATFTVYHLIFTSSRTQGSALGSNTYYPLPTTSNVVTSLTVSNTFSLDVSITQMAKQSAPTFSFVDMDRYYDGLQEEGNLPLYFGTSGPIFFKVVFTNNSGASQSINRSLLGLYMPKTLKRDTSYTETPPTVYDTSGNVVTGTVSVANGSSVTLYIGSVNGLRYDSSNALQTVSSTDQKSISFQLKYNGYSVYSIAPLLISGL